MTTTKLEFFKHTLNEFLKLKARNEKYDKMANEILDNDMTHDFPAYLSYNFCYPYQSLVLKSLAQLWDNPEQVEDNIYYLLYESLDSRTGYGKIIDKDKEYIIKDVDSLCAYLLDYYHIMGECKCKHD